MFKPFVVYNFITKLTKLCFLLIFTSFFITSANAISFFDKISNQVGCYFDDGESCSSLGQMYLNEGADKDLEKAAILLKKGCDLNIGESCTMLAYLYQSGDGVPQDNNLAIRLFQKGCDLNYDHACSSLAFKYKIGDINDKGDIVINKDIYKASQLYQKSCDLNNGERRELCRVGKNTYRTK